MSILNLKKCFFPRVYFGSLQMNFSSTILGASMRRFCILIITLFSLSVISYSQPFKASEAIQAVLTRAGNDTIANAKIVNIITIGDTTGFGAIARQQPALGALLAFVKINFNETNGTNQLWVYRLSGKKGSDTTHSATYVVVKLFNQYNIIPFDISSLLNGFDFPVTISGLSANFSDSDSLAKKVTRNAAFKQYRAKHPASKFILAAIGMNDTARSLGTLVLPVGPVWTASIGTGGLFSNDSLNPPLNCFVPAGIPDAEAFCFADEPSSVDEELLKNAGVLLYPNPANDAITVNVSPELYSPQAKIEVYSMLGNLLLSYDEKMLAEGVGVIVPTSSLPNGSYFVSYRGANGIKRLVPFSVSR
jgi:hypothetical protein